VSDRDAMKLALEALEALEWAWGGEPLSTKEQAAMQALRAALAAPEPPAKPEPETDALRRDAERYRWLKFCAQDYDGHVCFGDVRYPAPIPDSSPFDAIDAAIDAAMKGDKS